MEDPNPVEVWVSPQLAQSSWEEMLNDLLQDPDAPGLPANETESRVWLDEEALLGLLVDGVEDAYASTGSEGAPDAGQLLTADLTINHDELSVLFDSLPCKEMVTLPRLSSEFSSHDSPVVDFEKISDDTAQNGDDKQVSSPESCNRAEARGRSSNSEDDFGIVPSRSNSQIVTSCSVLKVASPDTDSDSSDVGAMGKSCDNFATQSEDRLIRKSGAVDEDAKRQSRLMRNRESATQSRLRKKSYIKELETKCRMMENQLSMLHQTVAFTSAQNAALREELAHIKCLKGIGTKSGAMEPAALPSDSLPSESPSRRISQYLSVKLVAFLCHVLLLTLLQALPLKQAISGESTPNKARSERRVLSITSHSIQLVGRAAGSVTKRLCPSNRRRKRAPVALAHVFPGPLQGVFSASKLGRILSAVNLPWRKQKILKRRRVFPKRSQYGSVREAGVARGRCAMK